MDIKRQGLRGLMKYILLPITLLSVAVLLSRCGQTPASVKPYKGASLVGAAIVSYDKATNNLTIQNFNAPDLKATAGTGPTVVVHSVATPTFNGSQVTGQVYITNGSTSVLTGVIAVVDSVASGTVSVANANYGNGFRANNPNQGPWSWWFYTGTAPNFNIPVGGQSNNVTWTFNATANFAVKVYVYAFCPSGVVMNRTATATGFANTPVQGAFVMLGNYPGDPNYIAEPAQGSNAVNYLTTGTDANGYFALPITTVVGNYITYTVGAQGSGTVTTPQFDNFTLYGTGLNYVILPIRQSLEITSYIGAGTSAGAGNLTNPVNVLTGTCQNSYMQVGAFLPAMGFEDLINLSLSAIMGPDRALSVIGGTGCGSSDLTTSLAMPSNLIVPVQNDNNLTIYTNASGTTSGIYMNTMATTTQGKDFGIALPANTTGVALGGIFGNLPNASLTTLTQSLTSTGNPVGLMGVLTTVSWLSFGYGGGLTTAGATINPLSTTLDNISHSDSTYTFAAGNWGNLSSIGGPYDPANEYTGYNVIALPGLAVTTNGPLQQLTTESLPVGTTGAPPASMQYVPANATGMPTGGVILPAAIVVDLNSLTANFSASTILADRTGYTTLPATLNQPFNQWYKLVDLQWPLINTADQQIAWTDANNPGVSPNPPSLSYVAINYTQPKTYTDVYGATQTIDELALGWEILGAGPEAGNGMTGAIIPTLPAGTTGALLVQPTNQRFYTVNILQGRARTSINGPIYTWDSNNNIVYVAENDFLGSMDAFSLTKFHVGGGWIVSPANNATIGSTTVSNPKAYINAYNWSIVSQGNPSSLRGCFTVQNNLTKAYIASSCTGGIACTSLPAVSLTANPNYAQVTVPSLTIASGVYSAITFTPYNSTAATPVNGGPACQQVGDPTTIYVHN